MAKFKIGESRNQKVFFPDAINDYLPEKLHPGHKTISEFRRKNLSEISELFQEIILIGVKLGLVKIGKIKISIDGTKIKADASSKLIKDEKGLEKLLSDVKEKVASI